jgi:hypothetical protein
MAKKKNNWLLAIVALIAIYFLAHNAGFMAAYHSLPDSTKFASGEGFDCYTYTTTKYYSSNIYWMQISNGANAYSECSASYKATCTARDCSAYRRSPDFKESYTVIFNTTNYKEDNDNALCVGVMFTSICPEIQDCAHDVAVNDGKICYCDSAKTDCQSVYNKYVLGISEVVEEPIPEETTPPITTSQEPVIPSWILYVGIGIAILTLVYLWKRK